MELLETLRVLLTALSGVIVALVKMIAPLTPLIVWCAFWTFAVDWVKLRLVVLRGGGIGVLLLMVVTILIWGVVAPPESGRHHMLGLSVSNFVGKTIYVTAIFVITMLCGSVQLSGSCGSLCNFEADEPEPTGHAH